MEKIDIINNLIKIFFISVYSYFIYFKITNNKQKNISKYLIILFSSVFFASIYSILIRYIGAVAIFPILLFLQSIGLVYITKLKIGYCISVSSISFIMTYTIYILSVVISGTLLSLLIPSISFNHSISLITIPTIMLIIIYFFFKIKRFKNGFYFLKNSNIISKIGINCIIFLGIILLFCGLLQKSENVLLNSYVFAGVLMIIITLMIWIQNQITIQYNDEMKNRTIDIQKDEIDTKNKTIEELKENNIQLSTVIHKYNNRFKALENAIINALNADNTMETSEELSVMLEDLKKMSQSFSAEVIKSNKNNSNIPATGIIGIDNIFKYMSAVAIKNNIEFNLKINDRINFLIDNIIEKEELETIIGDHIKDAIIAINSSNSIHKNIMVILGIVEDSYELCIYDTGIEFEIDILKKLGIKQITTHKESGGSGIGFMTTFNIMNRCKGSIIIEEYNKDNNHYTKAVIFRFDGKNEYKIRSYRAEILKSEIIDNRIILEKLT